MLWKHSYFRVLDDAARNEELLFRRGSPTLVSRLIAASRKGKREVEEEEKDENEGKKRKLKRSRKKNWRCKAKGEVNKELSESLSSPPP